MSALVAVWRWELSVFMPSGWAAEWVHVWFGWLPQIMHGTVVLATVLVFLAALSAALRRTK
jgi:hypothetical protein